MQKEHKKCTTSLMIWPQKRAQQTSQLPTRKRTKKTTTFRLKEHNFPDHFCTRKKNKETIQFIFHNFINKKSTKSAQLPWSFDHKKRAQQTSQLPMQKEHKKCTTSLMIWPQKRAQQTAQRTTRKRTKKTTTFRLKSTTSQPKNLQPQPPPNPRFSWTCSRLGPASPSPSLDPAWGRATR